MPCAEPSDSAATATRAVRMRLARVTCQPPAFRALSGCARLYHGWTAAALSVKVDGEGLNATWGRGLSRLPPGSSASDEHGLSAGAGPPHTARGVNAPPHTTSRSKLAPSAKATVGWRISASAG